MMIHPKKHDAIDLAQASDLEKTNLTSSGSTSPTTSGFRFPKSSTLSHSWKRFLFFLLPSFVQGRLYPRSKTEAPKRLHPTAWLDGMRGLAAFFVFLDHLSYSNHDVYSAWGTGGEGKNREILKLPFVRFFYTGAFMVAIFFVVSGYALSYKPVKQMRNKQWGDLLHTLSSSVFRRAIRLFLPCIASTLLIICLLRLGVYEWTRGIAEDGNRFNIRREHHPWRYETLGKQLAVWMIKMMSFFNVFTFEIREGDASIDIDGHLWTIPVEFRASLVLYLTQLGLSRLRPMMRSLTLISLIIWSHQMERWEMILFFGGFFLAELDIARRSKTPPATTPLNTSASTEAKSSRIWSAVYVFTFLLGIYLGGQPGRNLEHAPGWATLNSWIPAHIHNDRRQRYWTAWGGLLLVWSTSNHAPLQRIFTNGPVQYLGQLSFPLYLMHGAVIHTVGYGVMDFMWRTLGRDTVLRKETGFCTAAVFVIMITVWAADIFMRLVDTPTVKFAKWLEMRYIVQLD